MVPHTQRLSHRVFSLVWGKGKTLPSPFFIVRRAVVPGLGGTNHYAVVVSKKVAPKAVDRNRMRRRVYALIRDIAPKKDGSAVVVVVRKSLQGVSPKTLHAELTKVLG